MRPLHEKRGIATGLLLAYLALGVSSSAFAVKVDEPAPQFSARDLEGGKFDLAEMGGTIFLLFFMSPHNPYCVSLAPDLERAIWKEYSWHNFQLLGINVGPPQITDLEAFRNATGVTFPLIPAGQSIGDEFGMGVNSFAVVDGRGIVRYVSVGVGSQAYDETALKQAVSDALEGVVPPKEATWGRIKTLFEATRNPNF
jgi:peroxiredoxin